MAELKFIFGSKRNPIVFNLERYEGRPLVDIRKFFPSKDDPEKLLPTKKGISLNQSQIEQLEEIILSNKELINEFFEGKESNVEVVRKLEEKPLIGRSFNVSFNGGETVVSVNSELVGLKSKNSEELLSNLLEAFYRSAIDAIEDSEEFEALMNRLNFFLKRIR
jgi:hypothetical protein